MPTLTTQEIERIRASLTGNRMKAHDAGEQHVADALTRMMDFQFNALCDMALQSQKEPPGTLLGSWIVEESGERVVVRHADGSFYAATNDEHNIASAILARFARDIASDLNALQGAQPSAERVTVPKWLIEFLNGEQPDPDGHWFGDPHPELKGAFWWRKHLRAAPSPQEPPGVTRQLPDYETGE